MAGSGDNTAVQVFSFLNSFDQGILLSATTSVILKKGEALFRTGDTAEEVYFLEKGRLAVLKETGFNDRTQAVALLEPGASVGEGGALGNSLRTTTVIAIEESLLYRLDRGNLDVFAERDPKVFIRVLKRLLYASNIRLQGSTERLARIL